VGDELLINILRQGLESCNDKNARKIEGLFFAARQGSLQKKEGRVTHFTKWGGSPQNFFK